MGSTSLVNPQTLNLYAYCTNDPINHTDPSGLGFFSFFGKLFKAIGKFIKILAVILVVAVVLALTIAYAAPAGSMALSFAKFLLFKLAPVLAKILGGLTGFQTGSIMMGPGGTPPWSPNGGGLGGIGGFGWDDTTDVIRTTTRCRNNWPAPDGPNCPGAPWYKKLWRKVVGGIAVAIALGHVAYENLAVQEQRFGMWFLRRMDEGSKVQIGTYPNGEPLYVGIPIAGMTRGSLTLPRNARVFTNHEAAFAHLQRYHGIDSRLASERLHQIKSAWGRGPAQNVLFDRTGGVWDPATGQYLGSLTQGGAKRFR